MRQLGIFTLVFFCFASRSVPAQSVQGFTLVNADTETDIQPLEAGATLNLTTLPTLNLNVRADTEPATVGSVQFAYDGNASFRTESAAPYALGGDGNGDYNPWTPSLGSHTLTATPYSEANAGGTAGKPLTVNFTVVDQSAETPDPPTNLVATALSTTSISLTWDEASSGSDYRIERSVSPTSGFTRIDFSYFGDPRHTSGELQPGTTYYFRVRTFLAGVASAYSEVASATTEGEAEPNPNPDPDASAAAVSGELKKWHKITLVFDGPTHDESDADPNPFLDYRLNVTFAHAGSGKSYTVPGYFAANGNAAESTASSGNQWKVHFRPDETGDWTYTASFRSGEEVAISTDSTAGTAESIIDGLSDTLSVQASDKTGADFRARGRLSYTGKRYLQFAETGEYFVKGGSDAPENFLAYEDFDNTPDNGGLRKSWSPHADDWNSGDPSWQDGKGTEIIGALNYLASEEANSFSFLTMNIQGDDKNVYPYVASDDFKHFDVSKLDQWEIVFEHAQTQGLYLHFKTQETENDLLLDGGELGVDRKLYYRMLVARFGHHLALNWNLGEENDIRNELNDPNSSRLKAYIQYIRDVDPYDHHIVLHTYINEQNEVYESLIGDQSGLTGISLQAIYSNVHDDTKRWVEASQAAGKPWVVANDEQGDFQVGVPPDLGYTDPGSGFTYQGENLEGNTVSVSQDDIRKRTLWGNLMAGGAGVEYYYGYLLPQSDLSLQDFRSRDLMWDYTRYALQFFKQYLPFAEMTADESLVSNGWCLAKPGEVYAIYLENGGSTNVNLGSDGASYRVQWFNPRTGEGLLSGSTTSVAADGSVAIGNPPDTGDQDWVALLQKQDADTAATLVPEQAVQVKDMTVYPVPLQDQLTVSFEDEKKQVIMEVVGPDGTVLQRAEATNSARVMLPVATPTLTRGTYYLQVTADDQTYRTTLLKSE